MKLANKILFSVFFAGCILFLASCKIYSFRDVSVPSEIKTVKVTPFVNQARIVNPQLTPRLTEAFLQKIVRQTKLTRTNNDDAHYQIGGYISQYDPTITSGISAGAPVTNRLTVAVHVILRNTLTNKTEEYDVSRSFEYPASLSIDQAQAQLFDEIIRNMSDEIFNRIFSNW